MKSIYGLLHLCLSAAVMTFSAFATYVHAQAPAKPAQISVTEAYERMQQGGVIMFDIREPQEYKGGVAANDKGEQIVKLLPMSELKTRVNEIPNDASQPVLLICRTQNRSGATAEQLMKLGYTNITYVNGGMKEWQERKLPTVLQK